MTDRDQLMGTLEMELAKKGLTKSPSDKVDLYIGYQIARANEKQLNHYDMVRRTGRQREATTGTAGEDEQLSFIPGSWFCTSMIRQETS